jgi:hypothetical protein
VTDQVIRYVLDQSSGVVIALVLIFRMEKKLDSLESTFKQVLQSLLTLNGHPTSDA